MSIFINSNGQQSGPFDENVVIKQLRSGQLSLDDMAIRQGENDWQPLGKMFPEQAAPAPAVASNADIPVPKSGGCRKTFGFLTLVFGVLFLIAAIGMVVIFSTRDQGAEVCAKAETAALAVEARRMDYEVAKGTSNESVAEAKYREANSSASFHAGTCGMIKDRVNREWFIVMISVILGLIFTIAGFFIVRMKKVPSV